MKEQIEAVRRFNRVVTVGLAERELLDRASDELAESMLMPLTAGQRERLVAAMAEVEKLVIASLVRVEIADPRSAEVRYCLRSYFDELGRRFDAGFDLSQSISASDEEMTLPSGLLLLANVQGSPVGCGGLKFHPETGIAEVKRMWVSQSFRGLGLSRRLLECLVKEASARGIRQLRLETNHALAEARHLYETAGFVEVGAFSDEPHAHHWFQRDLHQG
ncbi:GNAT family N-acetyltransferase [Streptomyces tendae]|uniref:GNAT family N-acetyltransferase n=1 Tax=Streptomyces tendae TaxID=1932 RepID=UPI003792D392